MGSWVSTRRIRYKAGKSEPDKVAVLEAILGWTWDALKQRFQEGVAKLRAFAEREGHTPLAATHDDDGFPLDS